IATTIPADGTETRLIADMSGLPIFDRERIFRGYRGFGICRDAAAVETLRALRAAPPRTEPEPPDAAAEPPRFRPAAEPAGTANVVPFPNTSTAGPAADTSTALTSPVLASPMLTPVERRAFSELASRLAARLHGGDAAVARPDP